MPAATEPAHRTCVRVRRKRKEFLFAGSLGLMEVDPRAVAASEDCAHGSLNLNVHFHAVLSLEAPARPGWAWPGARQATLR